jgi:hypothetical protein
LQWFKNEMLRKVSGPKKGEVSEQFRKGKNFIIYLAVLQLKRLVTGFPPWWPGFASGQHVGFVGDKVALGQVFSKYFGFSCQSFHQFLHQHNHLGLAQ